MAKRRNPAGPPSAQRLRRWHRLFGLLLSEQLRHSPFAVELEMDLSRRQQLLDVVIVRRQSGQVAVPLPDGLDELVDHNLITFKSYWEALTDWGLKELTGHYVNYRKHVSRRGKLLPEERFRMFAVCARRPRDLFDAVVPALLRPGVYDCRRGTDLIRVVVAAELPRADRNAMLHLFSANPEQVQYAAEHYRVPSPETSTIVQEMFKEYRIEGLPMPYTMADFLREVTLEHLHELSAEERLAGMSPEERLAGMSPEERLAGMPPEEVLKLLSADQIKAYLERHGETPMPPERKKRKRQR